VRKVQQRRGSLHSKEIPEAATSPYLTPETLSVQGDQRSQD